MELNLNIGHFGPVACQVLLPASGIVAGVMVKHGILCSRMASQTSFPERVVPRNLDVIVVRTSIDEELL